MRPAGELACIVSERLEDVEVAIVAALEDLAALDGLDDSTIRLVCMRAVSELALRGELLELREVPWQLRHLQADSQLPQPWRIDDDAAAG